MGRPPWFAYPTRESLKHKDKHKKTETSPLKMMSPKAFFSSLTRRTGFGNYIDPSVPRDPPPDATQLTFPPDVYLEHVSWGKDSPPPDLQSLFANIIRPGDIHDDHAEALNVIVLEKCEVQDMIPKANDGVSFLPSLEHDIEEPSTSPPSYAEATKHNDAATRKRKDFMQRLAELQISNDDAYRIINKVQNSFTPKSRRMGHLRKFWEGMENMSRYWDCSLDNYYSPERNEDEENRVKRQRIDTEPSSPTTAGATSRPSTKSPVTSVGLEDSGKVDVDPGDDLAPNASARLPPSSSPQQSIEEIVKNASFTPPTSPGSDVGPVVPLPPSAHAQATHDTTSSHNGNIDFRPTLDGEAKLNSVLEDVARMQYVGYRISTGSKMPDNFRADAVTGFLEGVAWAFRYQVTAPRVMPRVQIGKLNVPVRQTAAVYRLPEDRSRARKGWLQGPVLAMQTRPETDFRQESPQSRLATVRLDLLREIGGLLQLAQERYREGKSEVKPGEGEWWTTKPRWGGGPGGDAQNDVGNTDVVEGSADFADAEKAEASSKRRSKSGPAKQNPAMLWKELKCGAGIWDPRIDYCAIGKESESPYDEVFLVSSINTHIAILKMTVHAAYLDYLASSTLPDPLPNDPEWCRPKLQRTQWFNLFEVEERCKAFQGLWGIMEYLTRETDAAPKLA